MTTKAAKFSTQADGATTLRITDPDDGIERTFLIGTVVMSVTKTGTDPAGNPQYQIAAATNFSLLPELTPEAKGDK